MKQAFILSAVFLLYFTALARDNPEAFYTRLFASRLSGARLEAIAPDKSRCDILTAEYALEVDFANKWAEAIGQSLLYSLHFNRKAGIVLIMERPGDSRHLQRLKKVIAGYKLPVTVWTITSPAEGGNGYSIIKAYSPPPQSVDTLQETTASPVERPEGAGGIKSIGKPGKCSRAQAGQF